MFAGYVLIVIITVDMLHIFSIMFLADIFLFFQFAKRPAYMLCNMNTIMYLHVRKAIAMLFWCISVNVMCMHYTHFLALKHPMK